MKILPSSPIQLTSPEILDPNDLNNAWRYAQDALIDVAGKRLQKSALVLPFVEDMGTPYTQAMSAEQLTYRFKCPETVVIERAFLRANMTSTAEVKVRITDTAGNLPSGATDPMLSTKDAFLLSTSSQQSRSDDGIIASDSDIVQDVNSDRIILAANTEYQISISSAGNFNLYRFDVILHVVTDRWIPAGSVITPSWSPTLLTDFSTDEATNVSGNNTALLTETNKLAANKLAVAPLFYSAHSFSNLTNASLLTFPIPRFNNARAQGKIYRFYLHSLVAAAAGQIVSATLRDQAGAALALISNIHGASTFMTAESSALSTWSIVDAASAVSTTPASDYSLRISATAAVQKAYGIIWVTR